MTLAVKVIDGALRSLPDGGNRVKVAYRRMRARRNVSLQRMRTRLGRGSPIPERMVYHVDPFMIQYATTIERRSSHDWEDWVFPMNSGVGAVQGGDWDQLERRVDEMRIVRALTSRVHDGDKWQTTDYFQHAVHQIESGRPLWGCRTRHDFERHCDRVDRLFEAIASDGYKERRLIEGKNPTEREVLVNLSRDGVPLFQDGRHRLAIARVLELPSIPVEVFVRHAEWRAFRLLLEGMAAGSGGASQSGSLYQPAQHFDLSDIPAAHECEDRWAVIEAALSDLDGGMALDIGTNLGVLCHRLHERGFDVVGIESEPEIAYAAQRIANSQGRSIRIVNGDFLDPDCWTGIRDVEYTVVTALNIFHHFLKREADTRRLKQFLNGLRAKLLFFEAHDPTERQMVGAFMNPSPAEFAEMIRSWAGLSRAEAIGSVSDGRTLFLIQ